MRLWPGNKNGLYSVASAYQSLNGYHLLPINSLWNFSWRLKVNQRVRVFIWQVLHARLLTRNRIARWGLGSPFCHNCHNVEKDIVHVLRDCPLA